jgi:hypothetical protein
MEDGVHPTKIAKDVHRLAFMSQLHRSAIRFLWLLWVASLYLGMEPATSLEPL